MGQKQINKNVDYFYRIQQDETKHQHNRMTWILASQSLIFAGLSQMFGKDSVFQNTRMAEVIICVLMCVGVLVSISAIYSMLISELSIGNILDRWDRYDKRRPKPDDTPHLVIAAPDAVLNSGLKGLSLYSFVPKVFCAAWIVLIIAFVVINHH